MNPITPNLFKPVLIQPVSGGDSRKPDSVIICDVREGKFWAVVYPKSKEHPCFKNAWLDVADWGMVGDVDMGPIDPVTGYRLTGGDSRPENPA
jgi:hypothetical protein